MENKDRRQEEEEDELQHQQQHHLGPSRGGETGDESPVLGIPTTPAHEHDGVEEILAPAEPRDTDDNGANHDDGDEEEDEESEFEFAFASNLPTITAADEIFSDGRIRPIYPVFDRDLFLYYQSHQPAAGATAEEGEEDQQQQESIPLRVPLRDLIMQQQQQQRSSTTASTSEAAKSTRTSVDGASSSSTSAVRLARASSFSSSDADDLEGVPAGTYCVWTPGSVPPSPEHLGKKSRSTGSTGIRRWSLRDLVLGRSHSDGRHKLMFFQHEGGEQAAGEAKSGSNHLEEEVEEEQAKGKKNKDKKSAEHNKEEDEKKNKKKQGKNNSSSSSSSIKDHPKGASTTAPTHRKKKPAAVAELDLATAHRLYYSNEASAGGGADSPARRRSLTFLPYRKDLFVGIFPHSRRPGRGVGMGFPQPPSSSFYGF